MSQSNRRGLPDRRPRGPLLVVAVLILGLLTSTVAATPASALEIVEVADNGLDARRTWDLWSAEISRTLPAPAFDAETTTCEPGSVSVAYLESMGRRIDVLRRLAGVGPVELDLSAEALARQQQAALMVAVGPERPTHTPAADAECGTAEGRTSVARSNLFHSNGFAAIAGYVEDRRVPDVGHRRWLLAEGQASLAIGEVPGANAVEVVSGNRRSDPGLAVAWPPAGYVPADLVPHRWSLQSSRAGLLGPHITVSATIDGNAVAVTEVETGTSDPEPFVAFVLPEPPAGAVVEVTVSGLDPVAAGTPVLQWRTVVIDENHLDVVDRHGEANDAFVYLMGRAPTSAERRSLAADPGAVLAALVGSDEHVGAEVDRLYHSMLGRRPDAQGRAFWIDRITSGTLTLRDVVVAFFVSPEFVARSEAGAGPGGWVDAIYGGIHDRRADADGRRFWVGEIDAGSRTRERIVADFYDSPESVRRRVSRLTAVLLGRPATEIELARWSQPDQRDFLVSVLRSAEFAAHTG